MKYSFIIPIYNEDELLIKKCINSIVNQKINYEIKNDYIVLNLNNNVFSSKDLIEETIYTLNLSIQDNYDVSKVIYYLDDTLIKEINLKNT